MVRFRGVRALREHLAQELLRVGGAPRGHGPAADPQHQIRVGRCLGERAFVRLERFLGVAGCLEDEPPLEREPRVVTIDYGHRFEHLRGGFVALAAAKRDAQIEAGSEVLLVELERPLELVHRVGQAVLVERQVTESTMDRR